MPDVSLSDAIQEAFASAVDGGLIYNTIELYHPAFSVPVYVVRDTADLTARIEPGAARNAGGLVTFTAYPFDIVPPDQTSSGLPQATITIDNVGREIGAQLDLAAVSDLPVVMIHRMYLPGQEAVGPENIPPLEMQVTGITITPFRITATLGFPDLLNKRFPALDYALDVFPGLAT